MTEQEIENKSILLNQRLKETLIEKERALRTTKMNLIALIVFVSMEFLMLIALIVFIIMLINGKK